MSVDYGSESRRDFIKSLSKAAEKINYSEILFSVIDHGLGRDSCRPLLVENRKRIEACFKEIWNQFTEIKIILAEDKHGRIRR